MVVSHQDSLVDATLCSALSLISMLDSVSDSSGESHECKTREQQQLGSGIWVHIKDKAGGILVPVASPSMNFDAQVSHRSFVPIVR